MYRRLPITVLSLIALFCTACASDYRVVKTAQLDALDQCAAAVELNGLQAQEQQQQLLQSVDEVLQQLALGQVEAPVTEPLTCPEVTYIASPPVVAGGENQDAVSKQLVGAVEQVRFDGIGMTLAARIDTGIATAVLDAREIQTFERNSEAWVRFVVQANSGEPQEVERKLTRMASLPTRTGEGKKRPVINMRFTLGRVSQQGEFILADRSANEYPVLLGRLSLRDVMIVDVSRDNVAPAPAVSSEAL
ncbi:ATP-dependent zinc protease family protein [Gilvimarinus polysaccharolyticus]|uniref:ATP-dependent zinc protease family protein n=1 Tax=Gilvimarinus polysaccharolyticus TaxID=863921 RepID=UPI0006738355|nr:RimK/LysX family protein [Gilvimarinus polysaccharolyticus]